MQIRRIVLAASLFASAGCARYRAERWLVVDAKTAKPILGAKVSVNYPSFLDWFPPEGASGVTDQRGVAELRVRDDRRSRAYGAKAPGYKQLDDAPTSLVVPPDVPADQVLALSPSTVGAAR